MRTVRTMEDVLALLDTLFDDGADTWSEADGGAWWDRFYADRDRGVPFFRDAPDECLVAWRDAGRVVLGPGVRVLELGCGPGRNAVWLARQGCVVDALDVSEGALAWARERATAAGVDVRLVRADVATWAVDEPYDLVYDSGCFHHLPPHRRPGYRALLERAVRPGGAFGLVCFAADDDGALGADGLGGSTVPDVDLYRAGRLGGGLAYTADELTHLLDVVTPVELRRMRAHGPDDAVFGEDFLWAGLFRR